MSHWFFLVFFCVHDTAATHGQYLTLRKTWSCLLLFLLRQLNRIWCCVTLVVLSV